MILEPARYRAMPVHLATRTGSSAATGRMFPVSLHRGPDRPAGRARRRRDVRRHDRAARGRAGAARARRDPRAGRAARLGRRPPRAASTTPTRRRSPRSGYERPVGARRAGRATRRSTTSTPTARRSRRRTAAVARARERGRDAAGARGLARAQGRLDPADRVLDGAVRPARRPRRGDRVHRHRGPARGGEASRASATSPQARAEELRAARRRIIEAADAAREQLTRDLHDGAQQQFVSALLTLQLAERKLASDPAGRGAAPRSSAIEQASDGHRRAARPRRRASIPAILTDRGLVRGGRRARVAAARSPVTVVASLDRRLPAPVEASLYFFVSEALTNVVKHARATQAEVRLRVDGRPPDVEVARRRRRRRRAPPAAPGCRPRRPHRRARRRARGREPAGRGDDAARHRPARLTPI